MGPAVDLRIKTLDVGIPMLHTKFEVRAAIHSSSANNVMICLAQHYLKTDPCSVTNT